MAEWLVMVDKKVHIRKKNQFLNNGPLKNLNILTYYFN